MLHYRAYIVGKDGHFENAVDLMCAEEAEAVERARQLVDGHDVELWQGARMITRFERSPPP
jgi:hypothetical protein